uniref:Uncharacterized protein n=1 Tax=Opuntia streptacantha TaxID=393608 RepID=A0A7C9E744_OPUST
MLWKPGRREVMKPKTIIWISFTIPHHWLAPSAPASGAASFSATSSAASAGGLSFSAPSWASAAAATAFSFPCLGPGSALAAGLGGRGGAAALCIDCETHRMSGVKAPVWYRYTIDAKNTSRASLCLEPS